jgi:hypothetical protein
MDRELDRVEEAGLYEVLFHWTLANEKFSAACYSCSATSYGTIG